MTWDFLHRWYMPFVWLAASSLVAVPLAVYFELGMPLHTGGDLGLAYGSAWVARDDFLASIVPYLMSLGCVVWLFNADGSTRWAAFWALLAAAGRIAAPVVLVNMADVPMANGQHYLDWNTLRIIIWFQDFEMFAFGILLWLVFGHFVGNAAAVPARAHAEAY
ncbi:MAG: hypothetical protein HY874_10515 [Chloroflexi bacterium]|nr:hypothetical protein [Chloroflexota bacterium]